MITIGVPKGKVAVCVVEEKIVISKKKGLFDLSGIETEGFCQYQLDSRAFKCIFLVSVAVHANQLYTIHF